LMLANTQINDNDLAELAERRAIAARNWLIENGQIPDERIFVVGSHESEQSEQQKGNRAEFLLK
jgi:outer membrane protein OmpA-like peptidoglycan-associated protein